MPKPHGVLRISPHNQKISCRFSLQLAEDRDHIAPPGPSDVVVRIDVGVSHAADTIAVMGHTTAVTVHIMGDGAIAAIGGKIT